MYCPVNIKGSEIRWLEIFSWKNRWHGLNSRGITLVVYKWWHKNCDPHTPWQRQGCTKKEKTTASLIGGTENSFAHRHAGLVFVLNTWVQQNSLPRSGKTNKHQTHKDIKKDASGRGAWAWYQTVHTSHKLVRLREQGIPYQPQVGTDRPQPTLT